MEQPGQVRRNADEVIARAMDQPTGRRERDDGEIAARIRRDGMLALDPPGLEIAVADVFAGL